MKKSMVVLLSIALNATIPGCAFGTDTGHLIVTLTDKESGLPITNATVTVCTIQYGMGKTSPGHKTLTSAPTDTNGVSHVEFPLLKSTFDWWVTAPSHHCRGSKVWGEHFDPVVEESDYENIDTNTVDGLAKFIELKELYESDDPADYETFVRKFEPKSVTYTNNVIHRSASFYPKHNPRPMYIHYENNDEWFLSQKQTVVETNGQSFVSYRTAEVDLKEGAFIHPHFVDALEGSVEDFRLERYLIVTNGVSNFYGWLVFPPNCGAYKGAFRDDKCFPMAYEADVSATYTNRLFFSYCRDAETGSLLSATTPLGENEYLVLRTRYQAEADGTNGWHYSEIVGPMSIGEYLSFKETIFNPVFNDPNLEYDWTQNLAE